MLFKILTKSLPIQEQCAQYWPESKNSPEKMGSQLSVELLSEGEFEDYICRELKITDLTVRIMSSYNIITMIATLAIIITFLL